MSTIDKLTIEIESQSGNAARGIDDLAKSLASLKKSGTISVAVKNLSNLSDALNKLPNVHPASNALRTLANSIEKLKGVGSISNTVTTLSKLPSALKSLGSINLDKVAPKIREVADAMAPLSSVKAGGLGTLVNGLARLDKVTQSLDDATIARFAAKVDVLNQKLGPLSQKMTSIKGGFSAINSAARTTSVSIGKLADEVNVTTLNFSNMVTSVQGIISALQPLIDLLVTAIGDAMEWDGIRYQFGNAFGDQADLYYDKITKITDALYINKQAFMENSAMATSMLAGFGVDKADAREMGVGYTQLAYDIWAAFNNVYKSLDGADGAMAAVRSAIAGEVEPIRRAGFTIVDSQLAITAANHGLAYSTTEATEAQKSYLRYLTLVDQAQTKGIVGTYAREMETAEGMTRQLTQQMKSLSQAFGSLFLPILVKVLPYVQAFVELLTEGVHWLAALFGVEIQDIGDTWHDYSTGVGDAITNTDGVTDSIKDATQAAKELKNASIGIDELNVISPSTAASGGADGSGGSGAGSGYNIDVGSLWDDSIFDSVQQKASEIKEKLKGIFDDWLPTLQVIGGALAGWTIGSLLGQLGNALKLGDEFEGKVTNIKKLAGSAIIIAIQFKLMGDAFEEFMGEDGTIYDYIEAALIGAGSTYLLYKQWGKGGLAIGLGVSAIVSLKTVIDEGGVTDMESAAVALTGLATAVGAVAVGYKSLAEATEKLKASGFVKWITEYVSAAKQMAPEVGWMTALFPKLSSAISGVIATLAGISAPVWIAIAAAIAAVGSAVYFLVKNWDEFKQAVKDFFAENIAPKFEEIGKHFEKIGEALSPLKVAFKPIIDFVKKIPWSKVTAAVGKFFEALGALVLFLSTGALPAVIQVIVGAFENLIQIISGTIQYIRGWIDVIVGIFTFDGEKIKTGAKGIVNGVIDSFKGLLGLPIDIAKDFFTGIVDWFKKLWDVLVGHSIVPDTINDIVEWFTSLPSKIFGSVSSFVKGVVDRFSDLGESLRGKFSSAWESVKSWWSKKPSLSTYTPSIGSIKDKISSAWTSAKNWWSKSKGSLSYTPSIGSVKDKLSGAWTTAKNWWNKSKGSLSYTPSIGSIKDKISSAWKTAKSWWNSNVKLSIPSLSFKVSYTKTGLNVAQKAIVKALSLDGWPKLSFAANGGIFDQGSLIWAGERGPEVMATAAGGKTGVMNVQQMQDAVYEGVYAAVTAAMRGNTEGGSQSVNIYLDGRQLTAAVEKRQRERGASIMGNEVYSY